MTAHRALTALNVLYLVSVLLCLAAGAGLWRPWGLQPLHAWAVAATLGLIGLIVERQLERRAAAALSPLPAPSPLMPIRFRLPLLYPIMNFTPEQQRQLAEWLDGAYQERNRTLAPGQITHLHLMRMPLSGRAFVAATVQGDTVTAYPVEVDRVPPHILDILAGAHE